MTKDFILTDEKTTVRKVRRNPLPALATLLKSHAASVGGHRGAKRRRVMPPRRVAPSGARRAKTKYHASPVISKYALYIQKPNGRKMRLHGVYTTQAEAREDAKYFASQGYNVICDLRDK